MDVPLNLLFVEDSPSDVELALRQIGKDGFEVSWNRVETEGEMRRMLRGSPPQLILSDFSMPNFDGMRALQVANEVAPRIPFIFLSGTIAEERAIDAIQMGATDYVLKGNSKRLVTAIRRALSDVEQRERSRAVEEEKDRLIAMLEATSDFISIAEPDGRIVYLNRAWRKLLGLPADGTVERQVADIYPSWVQELLRDHGLPLAVREGMWRSEVAVLAENGGEIPVSQVVIAHVDAVNKVRFYSSIARDIRDRKAYEERIEYFANYDALTSLPNRNLLGDRGVQALSQARRTDRSVALLIVGIDNVASINDSYGYDVGDEVLNQMAKRLGRLVSDGDTVAHLGSGSFAVLATTGRQDQILALLHKVRRAAQSPFEIEGRELRCSACIGISTSPGDAKDFGTLLRNADSAMRRAREEGAGGFRFYTEAMTRESQSRVELEHDLHRALERGEVCMHYQPQVDLGNGCTVGAEALMRWNRKGQEWVHPARFIPVVEESDLIFSFGEFALVEACRQIEAWDQAGGNALRIAVNASARQFHSPRFLTVVQRILKEMKIAPERLEIELTETVLVEDQESAVVVLKCLKDLGVQIAVDDFGTGYSSLSYLSRLPVDRLKIDQAFVQRVTEQGRDATIAQAIISLAHSLGLPVIAEGVETEAQLVFLREHGCDEAQGYLFSKPVDADSMLPLVGKRFSR